MQIALALRARAILQNLEKSHSITVEIALKGVPFYVLIEVWTVIVLPTNHYFSPYSTVVGKMINSTIKCLL